MKPAATFSLLAVAALAAFSESSTPNSVPADGDDQDVTANSLDYMPKLNKLLRKEGMEFVNYFVTTALCCPSRTIIINVTTMGSGTMGISTTKLFSVGGMKKVIETNLEK